MAAQRFILLEALKLFHRADRAALGERTTRGREGISESIALAKAGREDLVELEKRARLVERSHREGRCAVAVRNDPDCNRSAQV